MAEEVGVRIGIHPDDPPEPVLAGVPRCIFGNFEGYKRAFEIANSPNVGMCLCCGCWLEGGPLMGKDVAETIRYFGSRDKIWKIHFRDVKFDGIVILDHPPSLTGGGNAPTAYGVAYMTALFGRSRA